MLDLEFQLRGEKIEADHGYSLYSTVASYIPFIHNVDQRGKTGIHPISGSLCGERKIALHRKSRLTFRVPDDKVSEFLILCGKSLRIGDESLTIGIPASKKLLPSPLLISRLVTIKGFIEPLQFLEAAQRQMDGLGIKGTLHLLPRRRVESAEGRTNNFDRSPFIKRTMRVKDKNIVGFSLLATHLTAEESLCLQEFGLGGRRTMGCGIFIPQL